VAHDHVRRQAGFVTSPFRYQARNMPRLVHERLTSVNADRSGGSGAAAARRSACPGCNAAHLRRVSDPGLIFSPMGPGSAEQRLSAATRVRDTGACAKNENRSRHQRDSTCPVLVEKIFRFCLPQIKLTTRAIPHPQRGAYRDRHGRWARDAVDASAPNRRTARFRGRRSRVVPTPRRWRQGGDDAFASRRRWWQKSPVTRKSAK
jgi:hypothetical protein